MVGYETRCSLTGNHMKIIFDRGGGFSGQIRLLMRYLPRNRKQIETTDTGAGFVMKKRPKPIFLNTVVDVMPVDLLAYAYMSLIRWRFSVSCSAVDDGGSEWMVSFRTLDPAKYPGHCMILRCDPTGEEGDAREPAWVMLTPFDVIRIRDVFLWDMVGIRGEKVVIDSITIEHGEVTRMRLGGGPEIVVTKPLADRIVHALNEIVAVSLAQKNRVIGMKHGAVTVNNLVSEKPFAVANVSVGGMAIPLDRLSTVRLLVHMSIVSLRQKGMEDVSVFTPLIEASAVSSELRAVEGGVQ